MRILFLVFFIGINLTMSQSVKIPEISAEHKENANTIKINDYLKVDYQSFDKVNLYRRYFVIVYNETGFKNLDLSENYNKSNKIKKISDNQVIIQEKSIPISEKYRDSFLQKVSDRVL